MCSASIVLTRDLEACQAFARRLDFSVTIAPVRELSRHNIDVPEYPELYVATSTNISHIISKLSKAPFAVVGEQTRNMLEAAGFEVSFAGENLDALWGYLSAIPSKRVHYLRGQVVTRGLDDLDHEVSESICYEMKHRDWTNAELEEIESLQHAGFPVFSRESAHSLAQNLSRLTSQFRADLFPISANVAHVFENSPRFQTHIPQKDADSENLIVQLQNFSAIS